MLKIENIHFIKEFKMEIVTMVLSLLGGIALFLFGMLRTQMISFFEMVAKMILGF